MQSAMYHIWHGTKWAKKYGYCTERARRECGVFDLRLKELKLCASSQRGRQLLTIFSLMAVARSLFFLLLPTSNTPCPPNNGKASLLCATQARRNVMFLHFDIMSLIKVAPTTFCSAYIIWAFIACKRNDTELWAHKKNKRQKEKKVLLVMSSVVVELQLKLANCKQQQQPINVKHENSKKALTRLHFTSNGGAEEEKKEYYLLFGWA